MRVFIVEAIQQAVAQTGRDRRTQAILPLRGKILNVEKAISENPHHEEIKSLIAAMGTGIEKILTSNVFVWKNYDYDNADVDVISEPLLLTFFTGFAC